ncbi:MAG: hypothetical protein SP1CHLAM14_11070 [Chlamydiales bacterium]|nr:hypothetical protein [Chlamydiales bacterium]
MHPINPSERSLIYYNKSFKSLSKLVILVAGVVLMTLRAPQLIGLLSRLRGVSGWMLAGSGLGLFSISVIDRITTYMKETEDQLEVEVETPQKKNKATHIPFEEFQELVGFLQRRSSEMREAIEQGSLLEQTRLDLASVGFSPIKLTELPTSLRHLTNLTKLEVSGNELTILPDTIGQLTSLTELDVSSNQLAALPDAIGQLTNLTKLHLDCNQLAPLPNVIGRLTNLTELHLVCNQLAALPDAIGQLTNLTKLHLGCNQLAPLPNVIGRLTNLTELEVVYNHLITLPDAIGRLTNLTELHLGCNQLAALPDVIGRLTNLTELDVNNNQLAALPDAIGQLTNLTKLDVNNNQLAALPDTIGELTNLTQLNVGYNQLAALPSSIGNLSLLRELYLTGNPTLSRLPISLGNCSQLTYISLGQSYHHRFQSNRDQILAVCQATRGLEASEKLPHKIKHWKERTGTIEEWSGPEFTLDQKRSLYEWLIRLEKAKDFERNQTELAKATCAILKTIHTDAEFRETFFNLIAADLTACGDRAAMSLNIVYTDWKLHTLLADAPLAEKISLLTGCGRVLKLRRAVLEKYPGYENVEKVLYVEAQLRKRLGLVTAIRFMIYGQIGRVQKADLELFAQGIEAIPPAELLVEFRYWENYLKEHYESELSTIQTPRKDLLALFEKETIQEGEYLSQDKELQDQEQRDLLRLTQKIIDNLGSIPRALIQK